jgi:KUP system potassium uptake protein
MNLIYTKTEWKDILKALGLVFGDIGTSPIYTLSVMSLFIKPTQENILGILSLMIWTLVILVTVEYTWLAMKLEIHGEGGTIILKKLLKKILKQGRTTAFFSLLAYGGVALLLGDGVITPAISILSAVEGLSLIPGLQNIHQWILIFIAILITIALFIFQSKGTDTVAKTFGPIMVVWFICLSLSGILSITNFPEIFKALNPMYLFKFFSHNGIAGFIILSDVILCATGAEALYADMGHIGKKPIVRAWNFVFIALVLNYLGQGSYALRNPDAKNFLFGMVQSQSALLYIPFLILTIAATIIASQALISGVFSIIYQAINSRAFPRLKIDFTSYTLKSQIYISSVNWILMLAVIFIMIIFNKSENLAAAYGLAVTGTMSITGIMLIMIYKARNEKIKTIASVFVFLIDLAFLIACMNKLPHGGYWSIIIASFPFLTILLWIYGQRTVYKELKPVDIETFLVSYEQIYKKVRIPGTGLFFVGSVKNISPYIIHTMIRSNIIYENNIMISVYRTGDPFGLETNFTSNIGTGLHAFEINAGYKEEIDINKIISDHAINPKVIFYGTEDIYTVNPIWKIFSVLKSLTPSFVKFYKLPSSKLQGVITRVEMK